jgi:hypothetical protein
LLNKPRINKAKQIKIYEVRTIVCIGLPPAILKICIAVNLNYMCRF